jgi:hypothetical protein
MGYFNLNQLLITLFFRAQITCANIECPEHLGVPLRPHCSRTYSLDKCCATGFLCDEGKTNWEWYDVTWQKFSNVNFLLPWRLNVELAKPLKDICKWKTPNEKAIENRRDFRPQLGTSLTTYTKRQLWGLGVGTKSPKKWAKLIRICQRSSCRRRDQFDDMN